MNLSEKLDIAFQQFISHEVSNDFLRQIRNQVSEDDVDALVGSVESLGDPSEYCKDDFDEMTPAGFFLYVDFVSALIIDLGTNAIQQVGRYSDTNHHFVKWVVKFVQDERFHNEIVAKFAAVIENNK